MLSFKLKAFPLSKLFDKPLQFDSKTRKTNILNIAKQETTQLSFKWVLGKFKDNDDALGNEFSGCMLIDQSRKKVYLNYLPSVAS